MLTIIQGLGKPAKFSIRHDCQSKFGSTGSREDRARMHASDGWNRRHQFIQRGKRDSGGCGWRRRDLGDC